MELKNVNYTYPGPGPSSQILKDVSLNIARGDLLWIIGPSGSGKSTLLLHLNGLLTPQQGKVYYKGKDVHARTFDLRQLRRTVGMLFQYPENNFFGQTVYDDVAYGPQNLGKHGKSLERAVTKALERVGLPQNILHRSPFGLSGGEKRRAALAGVLALEPELLALDEPTAGLDPVHRKQLIELVQELNRQGTSVVIVSHEMEQVSETGGRVIVLDRGKITAHGSARQIMTGGELKRWGLDVPGAVELGKRLSLQYRDQPVLTLAEVIEAIIQKRGEKGAQ